MAVKFEKMSYARFCNEVAEKEGIKLSAAKMSALARKPVVGEIYDPEKINYTAILEYVTNEGLNLEFLKNHNDEEFGIVRTTAFKIDPEKVYELKGKGGHAHIIKMTATHIAFIEDDNNTLRAMSIQSFKNSIVK